MLEKGASSVRGITVPPNVPPNSVPCLKSELWNCVLGISFALKLLKWIAHLAFSQKLKNLLRFSFALMVIIFNKSMRIT